jgi:tRNA threonylcarbamoyladenosine biosynthesis protein TsaE
MIISCHQAKTLLTIGRAISATLVPPLTILLYGDLGAGKTSLVRGILRGCGYHGRVKSPSYTIVESYRLAHLTVHHFDFYRIQSIAELAYLGLEEYWQDQAVFCVEWPAQALRLLPPADLTCNFTITKLTRDIDIIATTTKGDKILTQLRKHHKISSNV